MISKCDTEPTSSSVEEAKMTPSSTTVAEDDTDVSSTVSETETNEEPDYKLETGRGVKRIKDEALNGSVAEKTNESNDLDSPGQTKRSRLELNGFERSPSPTPTF